MRILIMMGFVFLCIGVPFLGVVGFGWVMAQLGKMAVSVVGDVVHQHQNHPDEIRLDTLQPLNYDGRYLIGDDGELIEIPHTDEKRKYKGL